MILILNNNIVRTSFLKDEEIDEWFLFVMTWISYHIFVVYMQYSIEFHHQRCTHTHTYHDLIGSITCPNHFISLSFDTLIFHDRYIIRSFTLLFRVYIYTRDIVDLSYLIYFTQAYRQTVPRWERNYRVCTKQWSRLWHLPVLFLSNDDWQMHKWIN